MTEILPKTILLVEDSSITAKVTHKMLVSQGYEVLLAPSGEQSIDLMCERGEQIDLILMDIDLGKGMDGTEAAEIILETFDIPLIFLSSHTEPEIVDKTEKITSYGYLVKGIVPTVMLASIKMAFRLHEARSSYRNYFNHSINGLCIHKIIRDQQHRIQDCEYLNVNAAFEKHTGLKQSDVIGKTVCQLYSKEEVNEIINFYNEVVATNEPQVREIYFRPSHCWFELAIFPLKNDQFTVIVNNITEQKQSRESLEKNEQRHRALLDAIPDLMFLYNRNGEFIDYKAGTAEELLISPDKFLGQHFSKVLPPEISRITEEKLRLVFETGKMQIYEYSIEINGETKHFESRLVVCDSDHALAIVRNITVQKAATSKIQQLLTEKELLLRECHHRIENNMTVIQGMLMLQSATCNSSGSCHEILTDAANRIYGMMALYRKLYRNDNLCRMGLKDFLSPLFKEISSLISGPCPVETRIDLKELTNIILSPEKLSSLGIILNELITNSMKYAFKGRNQGIIYLSGEIIAQNKETTEVIIYFSDDGIGLPDSVTPGPDSPTFGMQLIDAVAQQLEGSISIIDRRKFKIRFSVN